MYRCFFFFFFLVFRCKILFLLDKYLGMEMLNHVVCIFNFCKKLSVFHSGCTTLNFHQWCMEVPILWILTYAWYFHFKILKIVAILLDI